MAKKTLYAYVAGKNEGATTVHDAAVVSAVEGALDALVSKRKWVSKDVWVVNQQEPPHWDLGINLAVPSGKALSASLLDDVAAIATELGALHGTTRSTFVVGLHDAGSNETRDLFTVDSGQPDIERLRASVGAALGLE